MGQICDKQRNQEEGKYLFTALYDDDDDDDCSILSSKKKKKKKKKIQPSEERS